MGAAVNVKKSRKVPLAVPWVLPALGKAKVLRRPTLDWTSPAFVPLPVLV